MNTQSDHHHDHNSGFMNGFLFGLILGAAVVFFLFTDKGRKLLKTITEEGIENFSDFRDLVEEEMDDEEAAADTREEPEDMYESQHESAHHTQHAHVEPLRHELPQRPASGVKRFFKGIKRG